MQGKFEVIDCRDCTPNEVGSLLNLHQPEGLFVRSKVFVDKELAHIVKTFYPDIRKILNNIQTCVKNNELSIKGKSFVKSDYIKEILSILSSPTSDSFAKIRQLVADNNVRDFTELYKSLYDNTTEASKIITIAEGLHNSAISSDREITFMATIAKLL